MKTIKLLASLVVPLALFSCGGGGGSSQAETPTPASSDLDTAVSALLKTQNMTATPLAGRDLPSINDAVPQLGRALFFSKTLSGDKDTACVSCHHPLLAGGDGLSLSVGVNAKNPNLLGLGRTLEIITSDDPVNNDGPNVPRNVPTTFNIALYDRAMFHDGRAFVLDEATRPNGVAQKIRTPDSVFQGADAHAGANLTEAQARFPVTSLFEMRGFGEFSSLTNDQLRSAIATRLQQSPEWVKKFQTTFNVPTATPQQIITQANIFRAISEYQRSQIFGFTFFCVCQRRYTGNEYACKRRCKVVFY